MKRVILPMMLLGALTAGAEHLAPDQALERALTAGGPARVASPSARPSYYQYAAAHGQLYLFDDKASGRMLVTSSDSRFRPVLAEVDGCSEQMAPAMLWWLDQYEEEMTAAAGAVSASIPADNYAGWEPIAPIVKSKWNQNSPYNDRCPSGYATGCVATAMAQIVYTNRYAKGKGKASYNMYGTSVSFDFASAAFDFDAMTDTYDANSTTAAKEAVAELMFACGVAATTIYGPESSANGASVPPGLTKYMGYDATYTKDLWRPQFQTVEWERIIYNELKAGRPVLYGGSAKAGGGHSFVCDGYSDNGLFHINWGWGGISDGYFALSALNPYDQGIGASDGGYNSGQYIVLVVAPGAKDPQKINTPDPTQKTDISGCEIHDLSFGTGLYLGYDANVSFSIVNLGTTDYNDYVHVGIFNSDNAEITYAEHMNVIVLPGDVASVSVSLKVEGEKDLKMEPGTYTLKISDHWRRSLAEYQVEVLDGQPSGGWSSNGMSFFMLNGDSMPAVVVNGQSWPHNPVIDCYTQQNVNIKLRFYEHGTDKVVATINGTSVTMPMSFQRTFSWPYGRPTVTVPWGIYDVCYLNGTTQCSARSTVRVGAPSGGLNYAPSLSGKEVSVAPGTYKGDVVIPETAKVGSAEYPVIGIEDGAFGACTELTSLDVPASVSSVGLNALRNTYGMTSLMLRSEEPPFYHEAMVTFGMHFRTAVYVPAASFDSYRSRFSVHSVFATLDAVSAPSEAKVGAGDEADILLGVTPATAHFNPDCKVEISPAGIVEFVGSSVAADGRLALTFKGIAIGAATVTVTPAQPGVAPVSFPLTVGDPASISGIVAEGDDASAVYDLLGRRVANPTRGLYIINGKKTILR